MQLIASVTRCPAVRRPPLRLVKQVNPLCTTLLALCAAATVPSPVHAQVVVRDLQPVTMNFRATAQDSIRAHQSQVRARQVRVRQSKSQADLPRIANNLTMSGDQRSIPLQLRNAPAPAPAGALPGLKRIAPSSVGVINSFIRGDLYTDADNSTASSLTTSDLTVGSDYRVSEDLMFGMAAGRLHNGDATGTTLSAYMTLQPLERIFLDMSMSYGAHHAHSGEATAAGAAGASLEGTSRGFTMTLNNPRQIGEWYWSPYSRYDRIQTDMDVGTSSSSSPLSYGLSAVSLGSTAATTWTTPFGAVRPMVMVEVQKEIITVAGIGTTSSLTQGIVGFGMTTKVSRDMSAFAESRYHSDLAATLDRQMMLGIKFAF
jgi:hypothetical protein